MQLSTKLKNLLLIRDHEWALVIRMFAFEFFQGASIALFFTSSMALFLDHHPIEELPLVFIVSAFLLWFFGWLYTKLEHRFSVKQITLTVLLFNAFSILAFRLFLSAEVPAWFYYIMLAWFNVAYLLNNLEFWGLASRLFDVRQSRRLFGIVSAGDIPAKFIGYVAAVVVVPMMGSHNLLWIAAGSSFVSLVFFHRLISLEAFQTELHESHPGQAAHLNPGVRQVYKLLSENKLIREVAFISFFTLCCFIIVNFVFYGYIKEEFPKDKSLATFIALFLAASRAITLIIKLFFTNRIADRFGVKDSLLITPIVLAVICVISFLPGLFPSEYATFYLFGMMAIVTDVLRSAIQSPVLLSTMQPLPLHQRLQGHNIMKGVMDPFAYFGVGVLLFLLNYFYHEIDFRILSAVIMILIILWTVWIFSADKNYIQTLTAAIRNRSLNEREMIITDKESLEVLLRKISGGDAGEAVFVLHLLKNQPLENKNELILMGLKHPGPLVRKEAIRLIGNIPQKQAADYLHQLLAEEPDNTVKAEALRMLPTLEEGTDFSPFLIHADPVIARAAVSAILNNNMPRHQEEARNKLKQLSGSLDISDRKGAVQILSEVHQESFQALLIEMLNDLSPEVANEAMDAACRLKSPGLAEALMKSLEKKNNPKVLRMLEACGPASTKAIKNFIDRKPQAEMVRKLIGVLGRIGGEEAIHALDELIEKQPQQTDVILQALRQSRFHVPPEKRPKYENLVRNHLDGAVQIIFQINFLEREVKDSLVANALKIELNALRDELLSSFALLYDADKMQRAGAGLKMNTRESVPNALELIDLLAAKEFSQPFICLFEHSSIEHKCSELKHRFGEPYLSLQMIRHDILRDRSHDYFPWTKAAVIYSMTRSKLPVDVVLMEPLKYSTNSLLRETVLFALNGNPKSTFVS